MLFENRRDALEQMIVTAPEDAEDFRGNQLPSVLKSESDASSRSPDARSNR